MHHNISYAWTCTISVAADCAVVKIQKAKTTVIPVSTVHPIGKKRFTAD